MHSGEKISALTVLVCGLDFLSREAETEGFPQLSQNIRKVIETVETDCSDGRPVFERVAEDSKLLNMLDLYYLMREAGIRNIKRVNGELHVGDDPLYDEARYPVKRTGKGH
jgi:hypothetical protein